jgi:GGDEF domain-containing protein
VISTDQDLNGSHDQLSGVLIEVLRILLKGLQAHTIVGEQAGYQKFQQHIRDLEQSVTQRPGEILSAANTMAEAMAEYSRQTDRYLRAPLHGLRAMLSVTAHTVATLCADNDDYRGRLDEIERQIEATAAFGDGRALRFRLSECLYGLRQAGQRQRELMTQALVQLREQMGQLQAETAESETRPSVDALTGLETRESAEQALAEAIERRGPALAAVFVVSRVQQVNVRFGYSTGNQVLLLARNHLTAHLRPKDRLFRWTGPAYIVLMERQEALERIEAEVRQIAANHQEASVSIGNQYVMVPITLVPLLVPLAQMATITELMQKIDAFAGELARH